VILTLEYEYDVPLIGSLIKGLLLRKMQQNCDNMLAAIKSSRGGLTAGRRFSVSGQSGR